MVAALPITTSVRKKRRAVNIQPRPHLSARLLARQDALTRHLFLQIKRLKINDALMCGNLRLEWIHPEASHKHYVLWTGDEVMGKVEVRAWFPSDTKVQRLAAILALVGFTDRAQRIQATVDELPKISRVRNLFTMADE